MARHRKPTKPGVVARLWARLNTRLQELSHPTPPPARDLTADQALDETPLPEMGEEHTQPVNPAQIDPVLSVPRVRPAVTVAIGTATVAAVGTAKVEPVEIGAPS